MTNSKGYEAVVSWFESLDWQAQDFQKETWQAYSKGYSGIVNAPTGSGKTYSILLAFLIQYIDENLDDYTNKIPPFCLIWISPIRALTKEIQLSTQKALDGLKLPWRVEIRTGDIEYNLRKKQWNNPPQILITTPESLHVLMTNKGYTQFFEGLQCVVVDEWHELLGSKRGVQTELFLSRMQGIHKKNLKIWGISATIANLDQAIEVLLYNIPKSKRKLIRTSHKKNITIQTIIPEEIETFPWAGHLGIRLAKQVLNIINNSTTSLIFTNTRAQCEIWYQKLLEEDPGLAGLIAMHHGSISKDIREWVEDALHEGKIKTVVCTSSLDLGVDFRPVDTVLQIGSPKGVARFIQRAGRSGHQPGSASKVWFVPTHALELIEAAGLRQAVEMGNMEERIPYIRCFDVLTQYLMTLAVSDGFDPNKIYKEIIKTHCFQSIDEGEWQRLLNSLIFGGESLQAYDEYKKLEVIKPNLYKVTDRKKIIRHKLQIGTIVSEVMLTVKLQKGGTLGFVEEVFASSLNVGDVFWFAGKALELVSVKDMIVYTKLSNAKKGRIHAYMGGRMPLSTEVSKVLRAKIYEYMDGKIEDEEMKAIVPLFETQMSRSTIPKQNELLVEYFQSEEGYHLVIFPFEGRNVHEGMAALLAKRISMLMPISFTLAMNDLGFELLSDIEIDVESIVDYPLFSTKNLTSDIMSSVNSVEMARRRFRDIARISGLVFTGYPGKMKKDRHIQASSQLFFDVFRSYDPNNQLYQQTIEEVITFQLEETRLRNCLNDILNSKIIISRPKKATPFAFPLIVDRLREKLSSEKLDSRILKMTKELKK